MKLYKETRVSCFTYNLSEVNLTMYSDFLHEDYGQLNHISNILGLVVEPYIINDRKLVLQDYTFCVKEKYLILFISGNTGNLDLYDRIKTYLLTVNKE